MAKNAEALSNDSDVVTEPDDGFTAEERTQFEEMQKDSAAQQEPTLVPDAGDGAAGAKDAGKDADKAAVVDPAAGADAAAGDDDDEDGDKADAAAAADPNAKLPRRVSYKKFARTEAEAKELREKLAEETRQRTIVGERLDILNRVLAQKPEGEADKKAEDADPEPNKEEDIFGHNAWLARQLQRTNERLAKFEEGQQATTADQSLVTAYKNDAAVYAAKDPSFYQAYDFLKQSRLVELALYKFDVDVTDPAATLTPQQVNAIIADFNEEEKGLAADALKRGKSPAARVMGMARARGFKPQASVAADAGKTVADAAAAGEKKPNGAAPANGADKAAANGAAPGSLAAASDAKPSVTEEIARVKAGQEAALSLSNGGGSPSNPMTPERLANMPQEEFEAMVESMSSAEWKRVASGG